MTWRELFNRLKNPSGVISWRYFLPNTDGLLLLHKQSFFYTPKRKNKWLYRAFYFAQQCSWFTFFGWYALWYNWKYRNTFLSQEGGNISHGKLFTDLFQLTFAYTIPPRYYFWYRLYQYPQNEWLDFIYDHEIPGWQYTLSGEVSTQSQRFLGDKYIFTKKLAQHHIRHITSLRLLPKESRLPEEEVFRRQALFFKPVDRFASQGCFSLQYHENKYILNTQSSGISFHDSSKILEVLNKALGQYDYLVQPLLKNSKEMVQLCGTERLSTLRLISLFWPEGVKIISGILEVPISQFGNRYHFIPIDNLSEGGLNKEKTLELAAYHQNTSLTDYNIPEWKEIEETVKQTHQLASDVFAIAWDVGLTDQGATIIEGNTGFSIQYHYYLKEGFKDKMKAELLRKIKIH